MACLLELMCAWVCLHLTLFQLRAHYLRVFGFCEHSKMLWSRALEYFAELRAVRARHVAVMRIQRQAAVDVIANGAHH